MQAGAVSPVGWTALARFWGCPPGVAGVLQPAFCFPLQMADCGGLPQVVQVRSASRLSPGTGLVRSPLLCWH